MGKIRVKVIPSSSQDSIVGWLGTSLKIKVKAPPEKGKANAAVVKLLAAKLSISEDLVEVAQGHSSPSKVISVTGLSDSDIVATINT